MLIGVTVDRYCCICEDAVFGTGTGGDIDAVANAVDAVTDAVGSVGAKRCAKLTKSGRFAANLSTIVLDAVVFVEVVVDEDEDGNDDDGIEDEDTIDDGDENDAAGMFVTDCNATEVDCGCDTCGTGVICTGDDDDCVVVVNGCNGVGTVVEDVDATGVFAIAADVVAADDVAGDDDDDTE